MASADAAGLDERRKSMREFWRATGPANLALLPLSWIFGACVGARRLAYRCGIARPRRMPVPVVVVGGIAAGGGGKTPFVIALARQLTEAGCAPGVISRGYRGSAKGTQLVTDATPPAECGDEPLLIRLETGAPVCVGRNRPDAAVRLLAACPEVDVILSDDGLQHLALARDLEIAAVDPDYGLGNGWMLPAGPLREPKGRLRTVDLVCGAPDGAASLSVVKSELLTLSGDERVDPEKLEGPVAALAGIANPGRFFAALEDAGIAVAERHAFPDHHPYAPGDLSRIRAGRIVMTSKDAVKCREFADERCLRWKVTHTADDGTIGRILRLVHGPQAA